MNISQAVKTNAIEKGIAGTYYCSACSRQWGNAFNALKCYEHCKVKQVECRHFYEEINNLWFRCTKCFKRALLEKCSLCDGVHADGTHGNCGN